MVQIQYYATAIEGPVGHITRVWGDTSTYAKEGQSRLCHFFLVLMEEICRNKGTRKKRGNKCIAEKRSMQGRALSYMDKTTGNIPRR